MTTKEIKEIFDKEYGFNLADRAKPEDMVFARQMYIKVCRSYHIGYEKIGKAIDRTHATVLYHNKQADLAPLSHKKKYNNIVLKYGLQSKLFEVPDEQMLVEQRRSRNQEIFDKFYKLKELTKEELINFEETRLIPYLKMIGKY